MTATTVLRFAVVDRARDYLGCPYHHQGRRMDHGVDCTGLLIAVAMDVGVEFDRKAALRLLRAYPRKPATPTSLVEAFDSIDGVVPNNGKIGWERGDDPGAFGPGDFGVFWIGQSRMVRHAGFFGRMHDYMTMIHTYADVGKVVEHAIGAYWDMRLAKTYRFEEFEPWRR